MKGFFDLPGSRNRAIVGQNMKRGSSGAPSPTMERLREVLADARQALPYVERAPANDLDRVQRIPQMAARITHLQIGTDHLPDFDAPEANRPSERLTISEAILRRSVAMRAGARLLVEPKGPAAVTAPGVVGFRQVPVGMSVVSPAAFSTFDAHSEPLPGADALPLTPLSQIIRTDTIERPDDMQAYGFRVSLKRSEQKERSDDVLLDAVMHAIVLGLARTADRALLGAINATFPQDTTQHYNISAVARAGLRSEELRAIVGTGENDSTKAELGDLFVNGIPAELSAETGQTLIGAFDRYGLAMGGEITLLVKRAAFDGSIEVACWAAMRAIIPDMGYVWTTNWPMPLQ